MILQRAVIIFSLLRLASRHQLMLKCRPLSISRGVRRRRPLGVATLHFKLVSAPAVSNIDSATESPLATHQWRAVCRYMPCLSRSEPLEINRFRTLRQFGLVSLHASMTAVELLRPMIFVFLPSLMDCWTYFQLPSCAALYNSASFP